MVREAHLPAVAPGGEGAGEERGEETVAAAPPGAAVPGEVVPAPPQIEAEARDVPGTDVDGVISDDDEEVSTQELRIGLTRLRSESPGGQHQRPDREEAAGTERGVGAGEAEAAPVLAPQLRVVRGVEGDQIELQPWIRPEVPGARPVQLGIPGFHMIDSWDAWDCLLSPCTPMTGVPSAHREKWASGYSFILQKILEAQSEDQLTCALKWFLIYPQRYRVRLLDSVTPPSPSRLLSLGTYVQQEGCVWKIMSSLRDYGFRPGPRLRQLR